MSRLANAPAIRRGPAVPVLMYHWVHPDPGQHLRLYGVTPAAFARQMNHLQSAGFRAADLQDLLAHLNGTRPLGPRRVVLTFDDGYRDNVEYAGPILADLGWTATIFVVTDRAGGTNAWDESHGDPPRSLLSWDEIRRHDGGVFNFESHSRTHPNLTEIDPARAQDEIEGSRKRLEDELRSLKKEKREMQDRTEKLESNSSQSVILAEKYRELQTLCESQFEQLKPLVDDETTLTALPELDEELLNSIDQAA